jgi:hypothetical protein
VWAQALEQVLEQVLVHNYWDQALLSPHRHSQIAGIKNITTLSIAIPNGGIHHDVWCSVLFGKQGAALAVGANLYPDEIG